MASDLFELYPDEQLGSEEQRMELMMKDGLNQPVADVSSFAAMGTVLPELYPSSVPFMFNGYEAAHVFFDGSSLLPCASRKPPSRAFAAG